MSKWKTGLSSTYKLPHDVQKPRQVCLLLTKMSDNSEVSKQVEENNVTLYYKKHKMSSVLLASPTFKQKNGERRGTTDMQAHSSIHGCRRHDFLTGLQVFSVMGRGRFCCLAFV